MVVLVVWMAFSDGLQVNPEIVPQLEEKGMKFIGRDETNKRMEIMVLQVSGNILDHSVLRRERERAKARASESGNPYT
jgi:hypothetical protein